MDLTEFLKAPSLEQIYRLQAEMLPIQCALPEPVHHFAPGMYMRELTIPAGMTVVGKKHMHDHFLIVTKGRALVATEQETLEMEAGFFQVSRAGAKRVVHCIEDTTFLTVHCNPSNTTDLAEVESQHIEPEPEEFQRLAAQHQEKLQ